MIFIDHCGLFRGAAFFSWNINTPKETQTRHLSSTFPTRIHRRKESSLSSFPTIDALWLGQTGLCSNEPEQNHKTSAGDCQRKEASCPSLSFRLSQKWLLGSLSKKSPDSDVPQWSWPAARRRVPARGSRGLVDSGSSRRWGLGRARLWGGRRWSTGTVTDTAAAGRSEADQTGWLPANRNNVFFVFLILKTPHNSFARKLLTGHECYRGKKNKLDSSPSPLLNCIFTQSQWQKTASTSRKKKNIHRNTNKSLKTRTAFKTFHWVFSHAICFQFLEMFVCCKIPIAFHVVRSFLLCMSTMESTMMPFVVTDLKHIKATLTRGESAKAKTVDSGTHMGDMYFNGSGVLSVIVL